MEGTSIAPIEKTVTLNCRPEDAFRVFTEQFGDWWPIKTHSIGEADTQSAHLESRVGGRIYEVMRDGREADWGTVTVWEPPNRVEFDWHVNPEAPGPTHVSVTFTAEGDATRVDFEHGGWEIYGADVDAARRDYAGEGGWTLVLSGFADRANAQAA
ncbi:MAG TPA: SRPBCC family protein [Actinomycetota bacterium]|jgi:hypothetical protein